VNGHLVIQVSLTNSTMDVEDYTVGAHNVVLELGNDDMGFGNSDVYLSQVGSGNA
jgi:hypothetical protein